jgi:hypothetical protein
MGDQQTRRERALVAVSSDRQWLVVLDKDPYTGKYGTHRYFSVYGWDADDVQDVFASSGAEDAAMLRDTGQDAEDVLRAFLASREEVLCSPRRVSRTT